jgi:hypothetical protein
MRRLKRWPVTTMMILLFGSVAGALMNHDFLIEVCSKDNPGPSAMACSQAVEADPTKTFTVPVYQTTQTEDRGVE